MISVLIADDHPLVRQGLRAVLDSTDDLTVAGEASDGHEAVRLTAELAPDVVIMDLQMPGLHGIDATRMITASSAAAVLVLTMFEDDDTVFAAVSAGAAGYLLKGSAGPTS